jgi:NADP-dependent alcohol dehydrogenase
MENFTYYNPTRIVFGKDSISKISELVPSGKVLITYGGGSIKKNGVYDKVVRALKGREIVEFPGIMPNPEYEHLMEAVDIIRKEKIAFILAVGGGSVIDGTKFISAAVNFSGDPWEIVAKRRPVDRAIPFGTILTIPATGTESNPYAVISRTSTHEKLSFSSDAVYPKFSILDPEITYSLPKKQIRNGIVDAYVHVCEQYLTYPAHAELQDRQAEAILQTLVEVGSKTLSHPQDYDARATFMWCANQALNRLISSGVPEDWATHGIGHELTAFYGIDHAESLAIVLPTLLAHEKSSKSAKLVQYGKRIWGLSGKDDKIADDAIQKTREFFESLGMPTHLSAYKIQSAEAAKKISERFTLRKTKLGEKRQITPAAVAEILGKC